MHAPHTPPFKRRTSAPRGKRRQRGALGIFGALTLMLAFLFAALSIDSGRLWLERRMLQRTADMAALDAARFTGCGSSPQDALAAAQASAARNGLKPVNGVMPVSAARGVVTSDGNGMRVFTESAPTDDKTNAVKVIVIKKVAASLVLGGVFVDQIEMRAEATAQGSPPIVAFTLGSAMLSIDPSQQTLINGVFGGLLGSSLNLSVLSYQGLVTAKVNLASMIQLQGSVVTVDELLKLDMGLGDALGLIGRASDSQQPMSSEAAQALAQLVQAANQTGKTVKLKDVLDIGNSSDASVTGVNLSVLQLMMTAVQAASKDSTVSLPINVPGIVKVELSMGAAPVIALGPAGLTNGGTRPWCTSANTASATVAVEINAMDSVSKLLQALTLGLVKLDFDMRIAVKAGVAHAHAQNIRVEPGTSHIEMAVITSPISAVISSRADEKAPAVIGVKIAGLEMGGIEITLGPSEKTGATTLDIPVATPVEDSLPISAQASSGTGGIVGSVIGSDNLIITAKVLGIPIPVGRLVGAVLQGVVGIVQPIVDPILKMVGVQPGAAMVQVLHLDGGQPQLVQ